MLNMRALVRLLMVLTLQFAGLAISIGLMGLGTPVAEAASNTVNVYVGYADTLRPSPAKFPTPWVGDAGVTFDGCTNCQWDAGAVRVVNNTAANVTIDYVTIDYGTCVYDQWQHNVVLAPGGQFIVTTKAGGGGNGCQSINSGNNGLMDSSDIGQNGAPWSGNCSQSGLIPQVNVSIDGTVTSKPDFGQVLNTGGVDQASCNSSRGPAGNESAQWQLITPPGLCNVAVLTLKPSDQTVPVGSQATVQANLSNNCDQPLQGVSVNFAVSGANSGKNGSDVTDSGGNTSFSYSSSAVGDDSVQASVTNTGGTFSSSPVAVHWIQHSTSLSVPAASGDYNDASTLSATLTDTTANTPISGAPITLSLNNGAQSCNATTNTSGVGTCSVTPNEAAGNYPVSASFAGGGLYIGSNGSGAFQVTLEQDTLAITSAKIGPAGTVTVTARLLEDGSTPISSRTVSFSAGSATGSGVTDSSGTATAALPLGPTVFSVGASFAADNYYQSATATPVAVPHSTALTVSTGKGDYNDAAQVGATLMDVSVAPSVPVASQPVSLNLNSGAQSCGGNTDSSGTAACSITPNEPAGNYPLAASFAGVPNEYLASNGAGTFQVTLEETTLGITSSATLPNGNVVVKALLQEDGQSPIAGRTITFAAGGLTGTGTTDGSGTASATLALAPGQYTLTATFAGDNDYQPASAKAQTLYVYQPTQFVIWGGNPGAASPNVAVGQDSTFWGAQWAKQVLGGDFAANPSFKGYADSVSGQTWTSNPGDSSNPPASVASYVGVIVATQAAKDGSTESGNVAEVVVLRVDNPAGYQPDPGHPASGVLVAVVQ